MTDWSLLDLLPGLWVGGLAACLVAGLRRWFDVVPWQVLAAFGVVLLALFGPVLFGGEVLLPLDNLRGEVPFRSLPPAEPHGNFLQGDLIQLITPSLAAAREAWRDGRWPLWNPRVGPGMPLLADPQAQVFQPLILLSAPLPLPQAAGVTATLRVLVALIFGFLWLRRQGLSTSPALAGALAFGLGGFLILWLCWPIANSAALLPLMLYAVDRCREPGGKRDQLLLTMALLSLLLGGHPETILYAILFAFLVFLDQLRCLSGELRRGFLLRTLTPALVALALAAPVLLPVLDFLPKTLRAARGLQQAATGDFVRSWVPVIAPNAFGNSRFLDYWGLSNTNEDASGFVGTATLAAALLSLGARRRFPQERLTLGIAALSLLLIPLMGSHRLLLPLSLCLSYLGACTMERFRLGEVRRRELLVAALGLGLAITWGYLAHPHPSDPERMAVFRFGWLRWQLRFLGIATLALLAAAAWGRRGRSIAVAGVAFLIAVELVKLHGPANPPMPRRLAFPATGPIRFLQAHQEPGFRIAALGDAFPPNLASLYGLTDARVYNPMTPLSWVETTTPLTVAWHGEHPEWGKPDHPLYAELGVRFLLAAPDAILPSPLHRVYADRDGTVWEVPNPRRQEEAPPYRPAPFLWGLVLAALGLSAGVAAYLPPPPSLRSSAGEGVSRA